MIIFWFECMPNITQSVAGAEKLPLPEALKPEWGQNLRTTFFFVIDGWKNEILAQLLHSFMA